MGFAALLRTGPVRAADPESMVLVLGDSISAEYGIERGSGWVSLLGERLAERVPGVGVVNASISGETTAGGLTRLPGLLERHQPAVVVIELGGNDALRGLDLSATESNLQASAALASASGAALVILGMQVPPNYGRRYTEQFAGIFESVAARHDAELVPFFLADIVDRADAFQPDRIHPSQPMQPILLDAAWPAIRSALAAAAKRTGGRIAPAT